MASARATALMLLVTVLYLLAVQPAASQGLPGSSSSCEAYVPRRVACPAEPFVTSVDDGNIQSEEAAWLAAREKQVMETGEWGKLLASLGVENAEELSKQPPPRMGIALSGGGLRATLNGAGVLAALTNGDAVRLTSAPGSFLPAFHSYGFSALASYLALRIGIGSLLHPPRQGSP